MPCDPSNRVADGQHLREIFEDVCFLRQDLVDLAIPDNRGVLHNLVTGPSEFQCQWGTCAQANCVRKFHDKELN